MNPYKNNFNLMHKSLSTNLRMMSEMSEDDFEPMLDQFCADPAPATGTENQREVELVVVDGPAEDADDDVIMLPQTSEPPVTLSPPAPCGEEKVNENLSYMLSILDSSCDDDVETGSVSGYQASKSSSNRTNLVNYTKYGT
jgi:hypothetical protein